MAVVEKENVRNFERPVLAVQPEWIARLETPVRRAVEALFAARANCPAESVQGQIMEALRGLEFESVGERADDAATRGMAGETLSAGDWAAIRDCVKARLECEARERETEGKGVSQ